MGNSPSTMAVIVTAFNVNRAVMVIQEGGVGGGVDRITGLEDVQHLLIGRQRP